MIWIGAEIDHSLQRLTCYQVRYFARLDEEIFFDWLTSIPAIKKMGGAGRELWLYYEFIDDESLKELLALFYRYNIDTQQLAQFVTTQNKYWFADDSTTYWHKHVFPNT